jgi:hypothetical protein
MNGIVSKKEQLPLNQVIARGELLVQLNFGDNG